MISVRLDKYTGFGDAYADYEHCDLLINSTDVLIRVASGHFLSVMFANLFKSFFF